MIFLSTPSPKHSLRIIDGVVPFSQGREEVSNPSHGLLEAIVTALFLMEYGDHVLGLPVPLSPVRALPFILLCSEA